METTPLKESDLTKIKLASKELFIDEVLNCMTILNLIKTPSDKGFAYLYDLMKRQYGFMFLGDMSKACERFILKRFDRDTNALRPSMSGAFLAGIMKAWLQTQNPDVYKEKKAIPPSSTSTDEGWYLSLVALLTCTVSEKRKTYIPGSQPAEKSLIPTGWDWKAVYRHLASTGRTDSGIPEHQQKKYVLRWISASYPKAQAATISATFDAFSSLNK